MNLDQFVQQIIDAGDEKKAFNIRNYKPNDTGLTDYIVVLSAQNPIHCKALMETVRETCSALLHADRSPDFFVHPRCSGTPESGWVVIDLNSIWVHIIVEDLRQYYRLDHFLESRAVVYHH